MSAEVDLDPEALRHVVNELTAWQGVAQTLACYMAPVAEPAESAAHFGEPDAQRNLATELAGRCEDAVAALSRAAQLVATLAEELRASADAVAAADQRSEQDLRAAGA